ncbi:uncharacterized protein C24B11.05 isoform X1 [Cucumis melo]|uniref:Uncharacterized protein C24B11.05 isoform X1 n=2 Tax=Cucumis melo TaxID=3656 RepID=A0ABM3L8E5_CUCME|nr:uncharacterized protein C24B11.05 isoform X1 [Cucumis melo]
MDVVKMSNGRSSKYECLLFDMDDTLYPRSCGINVACRKKIEEYMLKYLHMDESEVPQMCLDLYMEHGTTMAGLKALGYEFDNEEFHAYVHGALPYDSLNPDPVLRNLLLSLPQRKIIFTNADKAHAAQVLERLDLEDCFEGVICFETLNNNNNNNPSLERKCNGGNGIILCKPSIEAIQAAIKIADTHPNKTIFFDDSVRNIESGKAAGLHTVIVGSWELVPGADHALGSIHNIKEALPELWEGEEDENDQPEQAMQAPVVETMVLV